MEAIYEGLSIFVRFESASAQALEASPLLDSSDTSGLAEEQVLVASPLLASADASELAEEQALVASPQRLAILQS